MNIKYTIEPKSNVVAKSEGGKYLVIKTILSNVIAEDENGKVKVMEDLLTILPNPSSDYIAFPEITKDTIIKWILEVDTFNYEAVKTSLAKEFELEDESPVIVNGKLPYEL